MNQPDINDIKSLRTALHAADTPIGQALSVARRSTTFAWAFAAAYINAQRQLLGAPAGVLTALCVTEDAGNTPRAIETTFGDGVVTGTKSFVTFGDEVDELYVLCARGVDAADRKDLVLVQTSAKLTQIERVIETPFMPEVRHARVRFEAVPAELIREDAWPLIKAFRYVEDVFVLGAVCQYLAARTTNRKLLALVHSARSLAAAKPTDPEAHLAYDGLHTLVRAEIEQINWDAVEPTVARTWARDRKLLDLAFAARDARTKRAEEALARNGAEQNHR